MRMTTSPWLRSASRFVTDPFVGQLIFIRVYSGQLKTGDSVLNPRTGKSERIGRLLKMHANKRRRDSPRSMPVTFAQLIGL